jgi:hypothetical protein
MIARCDHGTALSIDCLDCIKEENDELIEENEMLMEKIAEATEGKGSD